MVLRQVTALLYLLALSGGIPIAVAFVLRPASRRLARGLTILGFIVAAAQTAVWAYDVTGLETRHDFAQLRANIEQVTGHGLESDLSSSFKIIALSNMAQGLANFKTGPTATDSLIGSIARYCIGHPLMRNRIRNLSGVPLSGFSVYLAHVNIVLGEYQRATGATDFLEFSRPISRYLSQKSCSAPDCHLRSYFGPAKYPADQAAVLYSLYLYDYNNGDSTSPAPILKWLEYMSDAGTDSHSGLHYSRIDRIEVPRGCALSWTIGYMNHFAPTEARLLWPRYKKHYKLNWLLFAGFREYPKGFRGKEDDDSGPIVFGAGAAATGFGLKAARGVGDFVTYYQIHNTLLLGDLVLLAARVFRTKPPRRMVDNQFLARAVRFNGVTERRLP